MSIDLFNKLNLLLTNPVSEKPNYSGGAYTNVANLYTAPRAALVWSNAMSQAALEYINYVGTNKAGGPTSIF